MAVDNVPPVRRGIIAANAARAMSGQRVVRSIRKHKLNHEGTKSRSGRRSSRTASWLRGFVVHAFAVVIVIATAARGQEMPKVVIAIHGGAGTIRREEMTPQKEQAYRAGLEAALRAGHKVLTGGGTSVDACAA